MQMGMVGLGRMGANMARRLARGGVDVIGFDPKPDARAAFASGPHLSAVDDLEALVHVLSPPRIVWLMVPAGEQTEETIAALAPRLLAEDVLVDGGNAFYKDSVRRAVELASYGVRFVDCGVSGGAWDRAGREAARSGPRSGLAVLRAERLRPLREDDPQRHRIRHDAGPRRRH